MGSKMIISEKSICFNDKKKEQCIHFGTCGLYKNHRVSMDCEIKVIKCNNLCFFSDLRRDIIDKHIKERLTNLTNKLKTTYYFEVTLLVVFFFEGKNFNIFLIAFMYDNYCLWFLPVNFQKNIDFH